MHYNTYITVIDRVTGPNQNSSPRPRPKFAQNQPWFYKTFFLKCSSLYIYPKANPGGECLATQINNNQTPRKAESESGGISCYPNK